MLLKLTIVYTVSYFFCNITDKGDLREQCWPCSVRQARSMVARPQICPFTPTFASAFNLKCCSVPLTFDSTFYFCFIKCDSNILIYVIFNAAYSKDSKFMSKEEMFKTSGNFIGLQALLRIMIDLLQMSLCELYVIFAVVPLIFISITHSFHHVFKQVKRSTVYVKYSLN